MNTEKSIAAHAARRVLAGIAAPIVALLVALAFAATALSCASRSVERTSVDTVTDLSGKWNDTDSRLVSEEMISDMLGQKWFDDFSSSHGKKPVIIAGYVRNRSSEHVETGAFIKDMERALINSGKATIVASSDERGQLRDERSNQQDFSAPETIKRLRQETGADFMLTGTIISQYDSLDRTQSVTYQVDLELVDIESNQKAWIGTKKIKKIIKQRRLRA